MSVVYLKSSYIHRQVPENNSPRISHSTRQRTSPDINMSSNPSASKPQGQAQRPISAFKAAKTDLLMGEVEFLCEHKLSYLLPYSLERTGARGFGSYGCPSCAAGGEGTCVVCLGPWDPAAFHACPRCNNFFVRAQLDERLGQAQSRGLTTAEDNPVGFRQERRRLIQEREARKARLEALGRLEGASDSSEASSQHNGVPLSSPSGKPGKLD